MDTPSEPPEPATAAGDRPREADTAPAPPPRRELRDPRELRALAHPLRLTLLEELATLGEATATELAARVGESPANCSWHLRQLAHYGYIEEAGGGQGRARPWRWVPEVQEISDLADATPEVKVARDAVVGVMFQRDMDAWKAWDVGRDEAPAAWRDASFSTRGINWLTPEELAALQQDLHAVVERHLLERLDRVDPQRRPAGSHLVRILAGGFPAGHPRDLPHGTADRHDDGLAPVDTPEPGTVDDEGSR